MYSQNDEEKWIMDFYGSFVGKFLDIGAHNGIELSNTRRLVELGWNGVCIEPSPTVFAQLLRLYERTPTVAAVNCAIDIESKVKLFLDNDGGYVSTLLREHQIKMSTQHGSCYRGMYLKTATINDILDTFGVNFNFINIDIEGMDYEILKTIPIGSMKSLHMICMEQCNTQQVLLDYVSQYGFTKLIETRENLIVVRK